MTNRVINGILVIVIGIVLLMNTTGYLPWSVWDALIQYWPLIVIGLGVQIAFSKWRIPGIALALILALVLSVMYPFPSSAGWPTMMWFPKQGGSDAPLQGSKQIEIPLDPGVSKLDVRLVAPSLDVQTRGDTGLSVPESEYAIMGHLAWDRHEPSVETIARHDGSTVQTTIASPVRDGTNAGKQEWDLRFHPSLTIGIKVTAGAADLRFDLVSSYVESFDVSAGVADVEIDFGLSGQHSVIEIAAGVANVELFVPESAGIKVTVSAPPLVTRIRTDDLGLIKQGNSWISEDFSDAATKIEVNISCGAGTVHIKKSR
jgi:hypothetical protein